MKYRKNKLLALLLAALIASGNVSVSGADFMSDPETLALEEQIFLSDSSDSGADEFSDTNEDSEENFISDDPFIDGSSSSSPEPLETEKELLEESIEELPAENGEAKDPADKINDFSSLEETPFSSGEVLPEKNTDYILGRPMTPEEIQEQLSLMGNSPSFAPMNNADSCLDISMYAVSDPYYDSRESGIITPVKNQNPFNICWAFSMASNFETSLLKKGLGVFDLSEEHLAYFFANRRNDPLGNTPEDKILHLKSDYHDGGNDRVASFSSAPGPAWFLRKKLLFLQTPIILLIFPNRWIPLWHMTQTPFWKMLFFPVFCGSYEAPSYRIRFCICADPYG